jgi:hypothetical protein
VDLAIAVCDREVAEVAQLDEDPVDAYTGRYFDLFLQRQDDGMRGAEYIADYFTSQTGVAYVGATAPRLGIFVVDASGPPRAMVGPVAHAYEVFGPLAARHTDETARTLARRDEPWAAA